LEVPGDLESTALRDRFAGLEDQIHSLIDEFGTIENLIAKGNGPSLETTALEQWCIEKRSDKGLSIDTHMFHMADIYSTLIQFAKDNIKPTSTDLYPVVQEEKPIWLVRNQSIFTNVRLSHFTSLRPNSNEDSDEEDFIATGPSPPTPNSANVLDEDDVIPEPLSPRLVNVILDLYRNCLLYGAVQPFDVLFRDILLDSQVLGKSPALQLMFASIMCHMLPHAYYWHREAFAGEKMDEKKCVALSQQYYQWAKRLLASIYFDTPSLATCHAICNLVLYHIESGNTSVIYIYSGMAVRMALSLQLYREDALDSIALHQATLFPSPYKPPVMIVKQYARSLLWFMYFLDTASSHYHNKPYEIHLDDHVSTTTYFNNPPLSSTGVDEHQAFFQYIEFHTCQITRDIRRTIFTHPEEIQTSYNEIERIERRLLAFQKQLPRLDVAVSKNTWQSRCLFKQWIRHHGHWILIHQSFLPTPMSLQRCTTAAFSLVELFDNWIVKVDCYFRPCVHELKLACEILLYHVDNDTPIKQKCLDGLMRLVMVLLRTPVGEIAKTRPFVQRVIRVLQANGVSTQAL
jgi:hypothetical protein